MNDVELAGHLAQTAGRMLLDLKAAGIFAGKDLAIAGDKIMDRLLVLAIAAQRPDDGMVCEETRDTPDRLEKSRVWIIDPLDGSREFGDARDDWAVHVGLAVDGQAVSGAVAVPSLGEDAVFRSDRPVKRPGHHGAPRILVSRTRRPPEADFLAERIGGEIVEMGSAGAKAMAVVRGEAEIYIHSGGQYEWDSCAPVAVAQGNGLHCSRIDGSPLRYNRSDLSMPDLLICTPEWADRVVEAMRAFPQAGEAAQ